LINNIQIINIAQNRRFRNCTHIYEHGCSVTKAVKKKELSERLYQSYLNLRKESEFYEMSYVEKPKKDKKFGLKIL